jgi:predicted esterase
MISDKIKLDVMESRTVGTFDGLRARVLQLHGEKRYQQALDLIEISSKEFPDRSWYVYYWRACFHSLLENYDAAIDDLEHSMENGGFWSKEFLLKYESDFEKLRNDVRFLSIVERSEQLRLRAQASSKTDLVVVAPGESTLKETKKALPLIMVLHGRASNVKETESYWNPLSESFLVGIPQSSQVYRKDGFSWDDYALAQKEIIESLEKLSQSYSIDKERIILGGFSQGAGIAIRLALTGDLKCRGFIAVCPALRGWDPLPALVSADRSIRGWFYTGGNDYSRDGTETLCEQLKEREFSCKLEILEGAGHDYPSDFHLRLRDAAHFILQS